MKTLLPYTLMITIAVGYVMFSHTLSAAKPTQVRLSSTISHPKLLEKARQTAFIKVDLTGFEIERPEDRTPVNVTIVLDKSSSMSGEKIEQAKRAAMMAIDRLGGDDIVSVVTYDHNVEVLVPATKVIDKADIRQRIKYLRASGNTALFAGVSKGARELRKFLDDNRVNRVILLSDGQANVGPSAPSALGDLGASLVKEGISVTTIGLGLGYNEDLMTNLAQRSDGNHTFVEHAGDLARIFDKEFGEVLSVVAQDVTVTITCEDGIRPVRVYGRDADIYGQKVVAPLNQLYSSQDKYIILEVETQPTFSGGHHEVAYVSTTYANMLTHNTDTLSSTISAHFTNSPKEVERHVNKHAVVAAIEQQAILNEERAIILRDQGKKDEAQQVLRDNAGFLERNASRYSSPQLRKKATDNLENAEQLDDDSYWNMQRKLYRSEHYKSKTQQGY